MHALILHAVEPKKKRTVKDMERKDIIRIDLQELFNQKPYIHEEFIIWLEEKIREKFGDKAIFNQGHFPHIMIEAVNSDYLAVSTLIGLIKIEK